MDDFFYNKYPYTDFHELNVDWIIGKMKKIEQDIINIDVTTHFPGKSVKEFGAKGDGMTNDTEAIRDAIQYCHENDIPLYFNGGVYICENLIINYPVQIYGMGSTLKNISHNTFVLAIDCPTNPAKMGIITDFIIDSNNRAQSGIVIYQNINAYWLFNLKIINIHTYGIKTEPSGALVCRNITMYCNHTDRDTYGYYLESSDNYIDTSKPVNCKTAMYCAGSTFANNFHPFNTLAALMKTSVGVQNISYIQLVNSYIDTFAICFKGNGTYNITDCTLYWSADYYTDASVGDTTTKPIIFSNNCSILNLTGVRAYPPNGRSTNRSNFADYTTQIAFSVEERNRWQNVDLIPKQYGYDVTFTMQSGFTTADIIDFKIKRYLREDVVLNGAIRLGAAGLSSSSTAICNISGSTWRPNQVVSGLAYLIGSYDTNPYIIGYVSCIIKPDGNVTVRNFSGSTGANEALLITATYIP